MIVSRLIAAATVAAFALSVSTLARADDWKAVGEFGWFGVGTAHQIEEGHFYWVGEFSGTFFNEEGEGSLFHRAGIKCPAFFDVDTNADIGIAGGYCVISDAEGDRAFAKWESTGTIARGPGTFTYTGGTGKYQGIKGTYNFVGATQVNWADGTSTGYAVWTK